MLLKKFQNDIVSYLHHAITIYIHPFDFYLKNAPS